MLITPANEFDILFVPVIEGNTYDITNEEIIKLSNHELKWAKDSSGNNILVHNDNSAELAQRQHDIEIYEAQCQIESQLNELYAWFDEYDNQIKQYERDLRMGNVGVYHIGDVVYTIESLDTLANTKAALITSLREELSQLQ